jgi:hypothetical protein
VRFVDSCRLKPQKCVVLPQVGGSHQEGYIDSGMEIPGWDNHAYVSVVAVREMVKFLGWPTPDEHLALKAELEQAREELAKARDREATIAKLEADVEWSLRYFGGRLQKKPGRPAKQAA